MRLKILLITFLVFIGFNGFADTVVLKSGKRLEGKIVEKNNECIRIDLEGLPLTYYLDEIAEINGEKTTSSENAATSPEKQIPIPSYPKETPQASSMGIPRDDGQNPAELSNPPAQVSAAHTGGERQNPEAYTEGEQQNRPPREVRTCPLSASPEARKKVMGMIMMFIVLMLILTIYLTLCMQIIAQKIGTEPTWLAWIPVANMFLMCKMAGISYWWLLLFLISLVPFLNIIGIFINLGFGGYIWYKIARARKKPGWIGVLTIVPIVNLFFISYLAFAE